MRALLLMLLTACWSTSQSAPPAPPPSSPEPVASSSSFRPRPSSNGCQRTIDGMSDKLRPEFAKSGIPEPTIEELIQAAIESCRAMEWSTELLACYEAVADANELNACQKLMTTEQSDDVSRRMMDVVSRMSQQQPYQQAP
ncbi:MAG: hypothetical protein M4D80_13870 [Myxococcota bacterium]|nr:hypothetical protein [Myxococcota bacterium]